MKTDIFSSIILRLQERNPLNMFHFFPINPNELEVVGEYRFKMREVKLNLPVIFDHNCSSCVYNYAHKKKIPHFSAAHYNNENVTAAAEYIRKFISKRLVTNKPPDLKIYRTIYGNLYKYHTSTEFLTNNILNIFCNKCGNIFNISAELHIKGYGCRRCCKNDYSIITRRCF